MTGTWWDEMRWQEQEETNLSHEVSKTSHNNHGNLLVYQYAN